MDGNRELEAAVDVFSTTLGWIALMWTQAGLARLTFGHHSAEAAREALQESLARESSRPRTQRASILRASSMDRLGARRTLELYAAGNGPLDVSVPLDLDDCTEFQRRVLQQCRRIPYGRTLGYRELAECAGSPRAARAVGGVMARNPIPLFVPCHRVLAAGGLLGGFSAPQGLDMKRRLLALEAAHLARGF